MPALDFICSECRRLLGTLRADASDDERERFVKSLRDQGFTPVHHFGWFCSRECGEAFFRRHREPDAAS